ncbi:hypothetical protein [Membranihabitans maritimus]|uniref:hypothetical protein n=1 Tax=Membranihabitans maritimus TaxID=2904244 RepID=UPI001F2BCACD|nr:hypothetical protein [Membranihabitans maritimus]
MRIIGQIDHPRIKITLFNQNDKLSVKFEKSQAEIILKFREEQSTVLNNLKADSPEKTFQFIEGKLDEILNFKNRFEPPITEDEDILEII